MIKNLLILIVALLHVYFLVLEMFFWTKPLGLKAFNQTPENAKITKTLAANQGLYNGFLSAGLIWSLFESNSEFAKFIKIFFLDCVIVAGAYGAYSVHRKIFFIQALPALIALAFVYLN